MTNERVLAYLACRDTKVQSHLAQTVYELPAVLREYAQ